MVAWLIDKLPNTLLGSGIPTSLKVPATEEERLCWLKQVNVCS